MNDTLNQFRRRLAQINGIKMNEAVKPTAERLSDLWYRHANHIYDHDRGSGSSVSKNSEKAASDIEKHVRKHYGPEVADDMTRHSNLELMQDKHPYVGLGYDEEARSLRLKHSIVHQAWNHDKYDNHHYELNN